MVANIRGTDRTFSKWDMNTGEERLRLLGHNGVISAVKVCVSIVDLAVCESTDSKWCRQFNSKRIVSGSVDGTVKAWDARTGDCLHTFLGHEDEVACVGCHGDVAVSGSEDGTIRVCRINCRPTMSTMECAFSH